MTTLSPPPNILARYAVTPATRVSPLGTGNINDTFLVETDEQSFILQRINEQVFPDPQILIHNLQFLTSFLQAQTGTTRPHWQEIRLVPTINGALSVEDEQGSIWRAISYIENSYTLAQVHTEFQAGQTGWALGHFHTRLAKLDVCQIAIPLPGFHHTSEYLQQYDQVRRKSAQMHSSGIDFCRDVIKRERKTAGELENALHCGIMEQRVIHGDPKVSNVLFDTSTHHAVSLIDLDTVGPGLIVHDIGDCLRSVCNSAGEETTRQQAFFDIALCRSALTAYFQETNRLLTPMEKTFIYDGLKTITFELGLRFFTDFLLGGIYFKCAEPEETLRKATVQFTLLESIVRQEAAIRSLCRH